MNNQEEKESVSSSDFCCCCSWVLFHREQMMASATKERRRCDARALAMMMMIRFSRRGISKVRSPWNHPSSFISSSSRVKEYFKARTKNVPSLRCRQSIFASCVFPRGVPVDLTERLAPRRRTVMMIPMMVHRFVSLSFCPFKGTVLAQQKEMRARFLLRTPRRTEDAQKGDENETGAARHEEDVVDQATTTTTTTNARPPKQHAVAERDAM